MTSAKIGVNVSPEEVDNLPVNGRNFANLMTLATGATSDGNGGWASVRFNGKSNQQNYLNYDGVDGTYVWDASPGYLNATGSQFRLQTSMESVAEFRVNSGLAPAKAASARAAISLSSARAARTHSVDRSSNTSATMRSTPRASTTTRSSRWSSTSSAARIGGPIASNRTFFFGSFEGLRQTTGLSFTEAVPSAEARRRILAGEPVGSGPVRAPRERRPLRRFSPASRGRRPDGRIRCSRWRRSTRRRRRRRTACPCASTTGLTTPVVLRCAISSATAIGHARSHGHRRGACARSSGRRTSSFNYQSLVRQQRRQRVQDRLQHAEDQRDGVWRRGRLRSGRRLAVRHGHLVVDRRARHDRHRPQRPADSRDERFVDHRLDLRAASLSFSDAMTWTQGAHTFKFGGEYRQHAVGFPVPGQHRNHLQQHQRLHRQPAERRCGGARLAGVQPAAVLPDWLHAGLVARERPADARARPALRLLSVVKEKNGNAKPFFIEENDFSTDPDNFYDPDKNNFAPRLSAVYRIDDKTVFRSGFGLFYGPGQFEDRIQPIENAIERRRVGASDIPNNGLAYPVPPAAYLNALSIRGYTHERPDEYNMQYGASVSRELPGEMNLTIGYTGAAGRTCSCAAWRTRSTSTRARGQQPTYGQIDYKTSGCVDGLVINGQADHRVRPRQLRRAAAQRDAPLPRGLHRRPAVSVLEEQGHDPGLERSGDVTEHVRLQHRIRHQSAGHPAHVQRIARLPDSGRGPVAAAAGESAAS